ncbi:O-methyltransferase [Pleomorphovibrio marinus]|uniref:O-methyltransferase n=1 Tax=Pleomorphovibrio marinus TaxID=2164132 RepID=UPI000E0AFC84|nr:class I SAM-dependent methyltransferase [Pleomorphovibrio marinus]
MDEALINYCERHSGAEDEVLRALSRETHLKVLKPRMLSGHLQGMFLTQMAKLLHAKNILEIGTYTGYGSICLARGLAEGGRLVTIDINAELETMARKYFKLAGLEGKIDYKIGNALELIPQLDTQFDLVFIDADKINYVNYYNLTVDRIRKGGLILADNILWSGKVLAKNRRKLDKDTETILEFNKIVNKDPRVENLILPFRDGIMMARRI